MKKSKIVSVILSLSISGMLLSGNPMGHQFAFYLALAINVFCWVFFWTAALPDTAKALRDKMWISLPLTGLNLFALTSTGHTALAASSAFLTIIMLGLAFGAEKK